MPRCQRYGASCGIIFAASSNVAADCANRPSANSSTARSRTAIGPCADTPAAAQTSVLAKIQCDKRVIVADIQHSICERRVRAHGCGKELSRCNLLKGLRRCGGEYQRPRLAQDHKTISGERHTPRSES